MKKYQLSVTTQGPTYPPSEVMDDKENFIVVGKLNCEDEKGHFYQHWGAAIVSKESIVPQFGENPPYKFVKSLNLNDLRSDGDLILHTLPLPLPCNNYAMKFSPSQKVLWKSKRKSLPFHQALIPDERPCDGRKLKKPITLAQWIKAQGVLEVSIANKGRAAIFKFEFNNLIPDSLYTVMALRKNDLNPVSTTRPGPLGIPNVFITDEKGGTVYHVEMPNPFPAIDSKNCNRIVNVIVLWMSSQMNYGGAIGHYGLGGDIHAQLKLETASFMEFNTIGENHANH